MRKWITPSRVEFAALVALFTAMLFLFDAYMQWDSAPLEIYNQDEVEAHDARLKTHVIAGGVFIGLAAALGLGARSLSKANREDETESPPTEKPES